MSRTATVSNGDDDRRRELAGAEQPERAAHRFDGVHTAQDDPREHVGERGADGRGHERRS